MATLSSILVWRIPWAEEPGRLQSMELQSVRLTEQLTHTVCTSQISYPYIAPSPSLSPPVTTSSLCLCLCLCLYVYVCEPVSFFVMFTSFVVSFRVHLKLYDTVFFFFSLTYFT